MQALPSFFFIRGFPHSPHLRKATPEPNMSSRKSRPSCNHLPTGTLGKVGVIRTANPKKSALGPSNDDNQSRPDDVSTKAGVKIQLKTAEDEVPHKKSVLGPSREESKPRPDDVLDRARFEVRPETAAAEDDAESQYESPTDKPITPLPTKLPTRSPTSSRPSNAPTNEPSLMPTYSPTSESPTDKPITPLPTKLPTRSQGFLSGFINC